MRSFSKFAVALSLIGTAILYQNFTPKQASLQVEASRETSGFIYLHDFWSSNAVSVSNPVGQRLPKAVSEYKVSPSGGSDYSSGGSSLVMPGRRFSTGATVKAPGIAILAPSAPHNFTRATINVPALNLRQQYWVYFKSGLNENAPQSTQARIIVRAKGTPIDSFLPSSQILLDRIVSADTTSDAWLPLGFLSNAKNITLEIEAVRVGDTSAYQGIILEGLSLYKSAPRDLSIARSNMAWIRDPQIMRNITDVLTRRDFDNAWVRDGIKGGTPDEYERFLDHMETVNKAANKRLLLIAWPSALDADDPSTARAYVKNKTFEAECGWDTGALMPSKVNLQKYSKRLVDTLIDLKRRGVDVGAFEIGNEINVTCYNGDLPVDRAPNSSERNAFIKKYAQILRVSAVSIRSVYPHAKIVSAGFVVKHAEANGDECIQEPRYLCKPGSLIGALDKIYDKGETKSYLSKYVDFVGMHLYPLPLNVNNGAEMLSGVHSQFKKETGRNQANYWITEWGFSKWNYNNKDRPRPAHVAGAERYADMVRFLDSMTKMPGGAFVQNTFVYDLDSDHRGIVDKVNGSYRLAPEADIFRKYSTGY